MRRATASSCSSRTRTTAGCAREECGRFANFVVVLHSDGTTGEYFHLERGSVQVRVGERVERGQWLALLRQHRLQHGAASALRRVSNRRRPQHAVAGRPLSDARRRDQHAAQRRALPESPESRSIVAVRRRARSRAPRVAEVRYTRANHWRSLVPPMQRNLRAALLKSIHFGAAAGLLGGCSLLTPASRACSSRRRCGAGAARSRRTAARGSRDAPFRARAAARVGRRDASDLRSLREHVLGRSAGSTTWATRRCGAPIPASISGCPARARRSTCRRRRSCPRRRTKASSSTSPRCGSSTSRPKSPTTAGEPEVVKVSSASGRHRHRRLGHAVRRGQGHAEGARPVWYVPASVRKEHAERGDPLPSIVQPGPDNPLGKFAMTLSLPGYLIHGTNKPAGVGMRSSHGCIRLYPEDIEALFGRVDARHGGAARESARARGLARRSALSRGAPAARRGDARPRRRSRRSVRIARCSAPAPPRQPSRSTARRSRRS